MEETGLVVEVVEPVFDERYDHEGSASLSRCFFAVLKGHHRPKLGLDPEQSDSAVPEKMLHAVSWKSLQAMKDDVQVSKVLEYLSRKEGTVPGSAQPSKLAMDQEVLYFRVLTQGNAYATQLPRGLFVAVGKLLDAKLLTEAEAEEYWVNRRWFERFLPVPPFYSDGNSIKAVTWYKNNRSGSEMFERMGFYSRMASKYGIALFRTSASKTPGRVVYEDEYQIGVVESLHSGEGFAVEALT